MAFAWNTQYYADLAAYRAALLPFPPPKWIRGVTLHHTYRPTVDEWRGARSMEALRRFYIGKGWSAGPHLFLAPDGIWGATPLAVPGIHAGKCNADHIGLEIVGDYDLQPWPLALRARVYDLVSLLCMWANIGVEHVQGHRECLNNKSCPGAAIDMAAVRNDLRARVITHDSRPAWEVLRLANIRSAPSTSAQVVGSLLPGDVWRGWGASGQTVANINLWADDGHGHYVWTGNLRAK